MANWGPHFAEIFGINGWQFHLCEENQISELGYKKGLQEQQRYQYWTFSMVTGCYNKIKLNNQ